MKRFLIAITLLSMLAGSLSLCAAAADPTPVANPAWDLVMEFDNAADAANWKPETANDNPSHTISDGQLHITASTRGNNNNCLMYFGTDIPANDANAFVFETKMRINFGSSTAGSNGGFVVRTGDSWASNLLFAEKSQVRGTDPVKNDNKLMWVINTYKEGFDVSAWHTWRVEITRKADSTYATFTYYLDGAFFCSTEVSNREAAAAVGFYAQVPANVENASVSVDVEYVKIANSFEDVPTTPDTPENPGNDNNDQPQAPDTGIVMIPVVAVAAVSALGLCTAKKRRG